MAPQVKERPRRRSRRSSARLRRYRLKYGRTAQLLRGGMVDVALRELGAEVVDIEPSERPGPPAPKGR